MSQIDIILYQDDDGSCPLIEWLDKLPEKAKVKCMLWIEYLANNGYDLKRPRADYLRSDIYELRVALQHVQYRMLYFFHEGRAIISHGCLKKDEKKFNKEIDVAIGHKENYLRSPYKHTYKE